MDTVAKGSVLLQAAQDGRLMRPSALLRRPILIKMNLEYLGYRLDVRVIRRATATDVFILNVPTSRGTTGAWRHFIEIFAKSDALAVGDKLYRKRVPTTMGSSCTFPSSATPCSFKNGFEQLGQHAGRLKQHKDDSNDC